MRVMFELGVGLFGAVLLATVALVVGMGVLVPVLLIALIWWVARAFHPPPRTH